MSEDGACIASPVVHDNVVIEELYPNTPQHRAKPMVVTIRVTEQRTHFHASHPHEPKNDGISAKSPIAGSKLVQRKPDSNMKLEQLNKHEERSYIQDAEANEAILKNTVSKDELCRFLTPLKFLEIQTWRKEVPSGDTIDEAEVEHRRWRTPIEILLPTVGREDDGNDSFYDGMNSSTKDDSADRKKSTSTNSKRRKFFDDVKKQNAEMLQRSNTDAAKLDASKSTPRVPTSADNKQSTQAIESRLVTLRNDIRTAEGRLRTAYAPANPIPPYKDGRMHSKKAGQIYVSHPMPGGVNINDAFAVASFSPGKPVLSRIRNVSKVDISNTTMAESKSRPVTSGESYQASRNVMGDPVIKGHRIQSSSWSGGKAGTTSKYLYHQLHLRVSTCPDATRKGVTAVPDDVQVLPFMTNRPQTVGNDVVGGQQPLYQRHTRFRGPAKPTARGLRRWNTRRVGIETTFNAATRLYQNSVLPKRTQAIRTFDRTRTNRSTLNTREILIRNQKSSTQQQQPILTDAHPSGDIGAHHRGSAKTTRSSRLSSTDHVTKISFALNRPNEIKVRTLQGPKQRETMSRVTPIPPIEMSLSRTVNAPLGEALYAEAAENGGIKYISANGVIEFNTVQTRKSNTPWVTEAFTPALEPHEDYYSRQQRQNKSVTFRLGAT